MTSKQTFMQRLKSKQQAKALFRSRDDLDIRKSKVTSQERLKRQSKLHSQRALPDLPVSPKRSSPKTHYSSSCENIYEEISEEFIKEVVRRKPQDQKTNQLSDDDYGFTKHDTPRSRKKITQNIKGMLSFSKSKLFSPKDEELEKDKQHQTRNSSSNVMDESMAIMPDMLYNMQVLTPSKAKQSCLCPHPHPRRPCIPPLRQEFSKPQSVQDTSNRQQAEHVSEQHQEESSADSQPSRTANQWVADMSRPTVTAAVSVSNPCMLSSSGIPSQLARPQNRTSCTDSITPYFSGGSDSGVSVSSDGSYGNSAQLSPMAPTANSAKILPYHDDSVFLNSAEYTGSRIPTMEQHQHWQAAHSNPEHHAMQGHVHFVEKSSALHPFATSHQTVLQPVPCRRVNNTLPTQSMAGVPQVAFSRPVKTLPASQVLRDSLASSDCDSKIDYLKPTCTHSVNTSESQNGFPLSPKDEGFSEPGVQESNFVRRAKEKIYQKLRHLDLAESDSNSNIVDPRESHIYYAHTDTEDEEMYPNVVGYKQRRCLQNGVRSNASVNQSQAPITFADIFTSISLRKGLHQVDTDTLSPVRDINFIPPPLPHRSRKVQCPVRRPLPSIPQSESECSSGAPSPVDNESKPSQPFERSKSLNNCGRARNKQEEPSDSNGQTSNLLSPNFHRHGLRKPIHGRRSVSSENSSTEQSDSEFTKSKTVRYSKGHSKGDVNSKAKGGPVKQLIKKKESLDNVTNVRRHSTGTSPSVCSLDSNNETHCPKTNEHNHKEDNSQSEHNQTPDSQPGFQPVQSKFNTDMANLDTSPKRLAVRATNSYRRDEYQKQSGSSSALSDLLRRNHDRQLLVFV